MEIYITDSLFRQELAQSGSCPVLYEELLVMWCLSVFNQFICRLFRVDHLYS